MRLLLNEFPYISISDSILQIFHRNQFDKSAEEENNNNNNFTYWKEIFYLRNAMNISNAIPRSTWSFVTFMFRLILCVCAWLEFEADNGWFDPDMTNFQLNLLRNSAENINHLRLPFKHNNVWFNMIMISISCSMYIIGSLVTFNIIHFGICFI